MQIRNKPRGAPSLYALLHTDIYGSLLFQTKESQSRIELSGKTRRLPEVYIRSLQHEQSLGIFSSWNILKTIPSRGDKKI